MEELFYHYGVLFFYLKFHVLLRENNKVVVISFPHLQAIGQFVEYQSSRIVSYHKDKKLP